jgi:radical SAM protein with 4Fe4S-binding SPASM domain
MEEKSISIKESDKLDNEIVISLIIPTYNNKDSLELLIKSLILQKCKRNIFEIIIVDCNPKDEKEKLVNLFQKEYQNILYLQMNKLKVDYNEAINKGVKNANGKYLIFLNDSLVVHPRFILNHLSGLIKSDLVIGYNSAYGINSGYEISKLKNFLTKNNNLDKLIIKPDFRNEFFEFPKKIRLMMNNPIWWFFAMGNFSIRKKQFSKFKYNLKYINNKLDGISSEDYNFKQNMNIYMNKNSIAFKIKNKKDYYLAEAIKFKKRISLKHVSIKLLTKCNAKCIMCDIPKKIKGSFFMNKELVFKLLDDLAELNVNSISFTGGEPTLRKDLFEIIYKASKLGFMVNLNTNGHLLNKDFVTKLKYSGLNNFNFSIDSADAKIHNKIRNLPGNFENIINIIPEINKNKFGISINSVIMKHTYQNLPNLIKLISKLDIKIVNLLMIEDENKALDYKLNKSEIVDLYFNILPKILEYCNRNNITLKIKPIFKDLVDKSNMFIINNLKLIEDPNLFKKEISNFSNFKYGQEFFKNNPCTTILNSLIIRENGDVYPCCMSSGRKKYIMGNIKIKKINEIISSKKYLDFIKKQKFPKEDICNLCKDGPQKINYQNLL